VQHTAFLVGKVIAFVIGPLLLVAFFNELPPMLFGSFAAMLTPEFFFSLLTLFL
jgi:hypothetical protein